MKLRAYQEEAIRLLRLKLLAGLLRLVLGAPCGFGKTLCAAEMIRSAVGKGKKVVFVAPRRELIDQTMDKLYRFGVEAGVIMASDPRADSYLPVQVCTIQTLARRLDRLPPADLIIIDECHGALSQSHKNVLERYGNIPVIGLTATPFRADKRGLADVFQDIVVTATTRELMDQGFLVEADYFAYTCPELHEIKTVGGDYEKEALGLATNTNIIVGSIVREYLTHAAGRRAIVFAVNVEHSEHIVAEFRASGIAADHVDANTPTAQRKQSIADFNSGKILVMSSVGIFSEGFDAPAAEVAILARPTKSLALFIQQVGRVLRTSPETGKQRALVHCHSGNILRHGLVEDPRSYALTATSDRVRKLYTCPLCSVVIGAIKPDGTCPKCGELIADPRQEAAENAAREEKENVAGERIGVDRIKAMREARDESGIRNDLTDQQMRLVARATREEKAGEFLRLQKIQQEKCLKPGFTSVVFRNQFGHWPKFKDEELAAARPADRPFIRLPKEKRE